MYIKMLYDDYANYTEEYTKQYGAKTVVFIEVGHFFEIYGVHNERETSGANMQEIGALLNIQISRKNKNILENSRENCLMAGFPSLSLKKYLDVLVQYNYTCVIVEQIGEGANIERKVTQVISPTTYIDEIRTSDAKLLMVVYLEIVSDWKIQNKKRVAFGVATVDLSTSRTSVFENYVDVGSMNEEISRLCTCYSPTELIVCSEEPIDDLFVPRNVYHHNMMGKLDKQFMKDSYQHEILTKTYETTNMLNIVEYLNMERHPNAIIALVYMLNFVYNHNECLLQNISEPIVKHNNDSLILTNNSMVQLDIVGRPDCLCDILNTCVTHIGKRYFKHTLSNPTRNRKHLQQTYAQIDKMLQKERYVNVRARLKHIHDIERIVHRKEVNPFNFVNVYTSLVELSHIGGIELTDCLNHIESTLDTIKASKYALAGIDENIFLEGYRAELDEKQRRCNELLGYLKQIHTELSPSLVKMEHTDKDGIVFVTTAKRFKEIAAKRSNIAEVKYKGGNVQIVSDEIKRHSVEYMDIREDIRIMAKQAFVEFFKAFMRDYGDTIRDAIRHIELLDFHSANALNAINHRFTKPKLVTGKSHVKCKQLRHPIIESIQDSVKYIPNDVELTSDERGIILYGINAAGKSSLMKSIGIAVIMAQAGMFVAAKEFAYSPYDNVFTRILNVDNLYKRQSTFTVEMSELRTILQNCTDRSLVIGDELCSGTESISAISLVTAGIVHLSKRNTSFIFATHLHEISQLDDITDLDNVVIKHLSVQYDSDKDVIVYDRVLKDGPGKTLYGLEVCRSLDMDPSFMSTANAVRKRLTKMPEQIVKNSPSKHNAGKYMDVCSVCKQANAKDMHHIEYQSTADNKGYINHYHKNRSFNLVALCKHCHEDVHKNKRTIKGYFDTSAGVVLKIDHD